jgi:NADPH2:quinone reductase
MSFLEAASLSLVYDTAWFALRERARLVPGETVLVLGASGGVGRAAVQLARAMGAHVLAGIARPERAAAALAAGANTVIDLSPENLRDRLREQVYAATDGRGVDIILDPLGGTIFDAALRALAWCGRLVVIGFAAGGIPTLKTNYLLLKNIEVSGLQVSDYRKRRPAQVAACYAEIFALYDQGKLQPDATMTFPLERGKRWPHCVNAASMPAPCCGCVKPAPGPLCRPSAIGRTPPGSPAAGTTLFIYAARQPGLSGSLRRHVPAYKSPARIGAEVR